jgi:hypothetical protein
VNQTHEVSLRGGGLGHWAAEHALECCYLKRLFLTKLNQFNQAKI